MTTNTTNIAPDAALVNLAWHTLAALGIKWAKAQFAFGGHHIASISSTHVIAVFNKAGVATRYVVYTEKFSRTPDYVLDLVLVVLDWDMYMLVS